MNTGADFVKRIRPVGCVLFLLLAAAVVVLCFTTGRDPIPGHEAAHDTAYYEANLPALQAELEAEVFPALAGVVACRAEGDRLLVTLRGPDFAVTRAAILRYYDAGLFTFSEEN